MCLKGYYPGGVEWGNNGGSGNPSRNCTIQLYMYISSRENIILWIYFCINDPVNVPQEREVY